MKNLFQQETVQEVTNRLNKLQPTAQRQWGKMNVAQMLAHCSAAMEVAVGLKRPPQIFIGRIIGRFLKSAFQNEKPLKRNTPTDKSFIIANPQDFELERSRLITLVTQF